VKGLGFTNQVWEVHIYGDVPQCIEVNAPTREAAINRVLTDILARLEFDAQVQNPDAEPETPCTPIGEHKAKSRPGSTPTPGGEGKAKP
jgi:hypothetical protein